MIEFVDATINDRWSLVLPDFRERFHSARTGWEAGRLAHMAETVKPGMTIFDVGAELGDFTSLYKLWIGPEGRVIPVEPSVPMWPSIRGTWQANGFGSSDGWYAGFASDVTAEPSLPYEGDTTPLEDGWPAMAAGEVRDDPGFRHLAQETARVPQTRLDWLATRLVPPDVIVLDVEGAEYRALEGCAGILAHYRPAAVYVSVHDIGDAQWPGSLAGWYGRTVDDIHELMAGYGYAGTLLEGHGEGEHFWVYEPA